MTASPVPAGAALLATKLFLPRPRERLVARSRLEARLVEGRARPLTLVAAPAGFGKTTLVAQWLAGQQDAGQVRVGWLSLDEDDNDPARFLAYLVAALRAAEPAVAEAALALLQAPQPPPPDAVVTALINEVAARPGGPGLVLVLDDYHHLRAPAIHAAVARLVDRLPPALRLILLTRADPPLPLARWRVRDQLAEVRVEDLRFAPAEAAAFLNQVMGLDLGPDDIAALEARTEGWVAGLQLAALSLRGRADPAAFVSAFASSPLVVIDYLAEEVLQREPAETQTFLLQTSIVDRLSGALASELTGRPDGPARLEALRQHNLFVSALDDERQWYRYHRLFADVLRARLRQTRPAEVPELHRRASAWFERQGWPEEAVTHALAVPDFDRAARLIEAGRVRLALAGQVNTLQQWLAALPPALCQARPGLGLAQAWALGTLGDYAAASACLTTAEAALASVPDAEARALRLELSVARAVTASFGEDPDSVALTQAALAALPADAAVLRQTLQTALALDYFRTGQLAAADRTVVELLEQIDPRAASQVAGLMAMLGMLRRQQGRLRDAVQLSEQAIGRLTWHGRVAPDAGAILAYATLGAAAYERLALDEAERHWQACVELARTAGNTGTRLFALAGLAQAALARGDQPAARGRLIEAEALVGASSIGPSDRTIFEAARARLWIAAGDAPAAEAWARQHTRPVGASPLTPYDYERLVLPEALLAQGRPAEALAALEPLAAAAAATGHGDFLVKALALRAAALERHGQVGAAQAARRRARELADPEGYRAIFQLTEARGVPAASPALIEPLSDREREILRLVAQGLSDRAVAERLVVVVGTVKKHLSNVYGKLGVRSRTQALARARELGLLE